MNLEHLEALAAEIPSVLQRILFGAVGTGQVGSDSSSQEVRRRATSQKLARNNFGIACHTGVMQ
jgi:hypothetical protein